MKLHIKNFRSIKQLDLELAPITVLYGHNGTGKSSVLYAPLTLKNIVLNPNQHIQEFFNYRFTSLGAFNEIVFDHNPTNELELGISLEVPTKDNARIDLNYKITLLNNNSGSFQFEVSGPSGISDSLRLSCSFPHGPEDWERFENIGVGEFLWDGIEVEIDDESLGEYEQDDSISTIIDKNILGCPVRMLKDVSFVPLGRGFFQPLYSFEHKGNGSSNTHTEQEVTDLLANDRHLEYAISHRMEQILNRDFRVRNQIGSSDFSLDSIDRRSRVAASLVNEGFGVNQLVYMLAKVLHSDAGIVCIEEPEIHLHPSAVRRLARALADIARENGDKHLIISTHSEQFVMSLLALVAEGIHSPDDLAMYLVTKEGKESKFQRQQVNENGQIEGGFASFIEGELEDMKAFLGV